MKDVIWFWLGLVLLSVGCCFIFLVALDFSSGADDLTIVVVDTFSSPDYSGYGVYDGESCRLYNGYLDYGKVS